MIEWIVVGVFLLAAGATIYFWDWVRTAITDWLRHNGYASSRLMDVIVKLDRVICGIRARARIYVKTQRSYPETRIKEEEISWSSLPESARRELKSKGHATLRYSH